MTCRWPRNKPMRKYTPKSVDTMMMCVVTFFNRWLKVNLGMEASDWPHYSDNDPEPYSDEEIVALEKCTTGTSNLLVRVFRSTGCRDMEIAHLSSDDVNPRTKEILIRRKQCFHCRDCGSQNNVWKPKTEAGTRNIPVGDSLLAELLALPKGLLFPNRRGKVDQHMLRKIKRAAKKSKCGKSQNFIASVTRLAQAEQTSCVRGVDVRTVQRWAGHEDVNVTMGYAAWLDGQSKAARDAANREDTRYRKTGTQGD